MLKFRSKWSDHILDSCMEDDQIPSLSPILYFTYQKNHTTPCDWNNVKRPGINFKIQSDLIKTIGVDMLDYSF